MNNPSRGDERRYHRDQSGSRRPIKPVADQMLIQEQLVRDNVSGLTLRFEKLADGRFALHISGSLLSGSQTFIFSSNGLFELIESRGHSGPLVRSREVC